MKADDWNGKRVSITGATGFIGRHLVTRLAALGARVRGIDLHLDRIDPHAGGSTEENASTGDDGTNVELREGSILDPAHDRWLLEGCDVLFHCAAVVEESGELEFFRALNVGATVRLARKARHHKVREFIQLSSIMVYGFHYRAYVTEAGPFHGEGNPYCITKIEGEKSLAHILGEESNTRLTIIRPGDVFGPGSRPWVVRPASMLHRGLFALPQNGLGTMNAVYIENLVDVLLLAAARVPRRPHVFNVIDTHIKWHEYFAHLASAIQSRRALNVPGSLLKLGVGLADKVGLNIGASASAVDFISREHPVSYERTRSALGYEPRVPFDEAIQRTKQWLIDHPEQWNGA